jgi:hypothetical protein
MLQRGRKSAAKLEINVTGAPQKLKTPTGLSVAERALFEQLVASTDPKHFRVSDMPMLIAYVQSSLMSRKLARQPKKVGDWEKVTRTMASLATRLRLTPHSRADAKVIGHQQPPDQENAPWQPSGKQPWTRNEDSTKIQ